jgi:lysosomal Pro-X carboxypeptidase
VRGEQDRNSHVDGHAWRDHGGRKEAEQANADYAWFVTSLKANLSAPNAPVVLFGGSYGGMLAAWMRIKFPTISAGAIASSAPVLEVPGIMDPT